MIASTRAPLTIMAALLLATLALTSCASGADPGATSTEHKVSIKGTVGEMPQVNFKPPIEPSSSTVSRVVQGKGGPVVAGQPVVLNITLVDGRTGKLALSTYSQGQQALATTPASDALFPVVQQTLQNAVSGDRILIEAPARDAFGDAGAPQYKVRPGDPLIMVVDVMGTPPTEVLEKASGTAQTVPKRRPRVVEQSGRPVSVEFPRRRFKGKQLVVIPLIKGTGPAVSNGHIVTLHYLQQVWGESKPFTDTWSQKPQSLVFDTSLVQTWQSGLDQVTRGSRVLIIAPAGMASPELNGVTPKAPVVYVVDVLGVG